MTQAKNLCLSTNSKHAHLTPKIGVSGSANIDFLPENTYEIAKELGKEIADQGAILVSGATTGFPFWVAMGTKQAGGISIGLSPASNDKEHTHVYKLPLDYMDVIVYTGFGYSGRDLFFTRSADAIIIGPGRIGTIHEFTIAYEDEKPMGILQGDGVWETDEILKTIIEKSHRVNKNVIFDDNPARLVKRLIAMVNERNKKNYVYKNDDPFGGSVGKLML